jgi:hypothetical protein
VLTVIVGTYVRLRDARLIRLEESIRVLFRGMTPVALEGDFPGRFPLDFSPDSPCLRVPPDMSAAIELGRHQRDPPKNCFTFRGHSKRASASEQPDHSHDQAQEQA